jgi:hypothetical protein
MDTAIRIPGIGFRIGLDPILGLIPGAGDLITTGFSAYLIYLAARFRLPTKVIGQMIFNIALEGVVGGIPLIGDLFDAAYKSNIRNLALLEQHLQIVDPELNAIESLDNSIDSPTPIESKQVAVVSKPAV